MRAFAYACLLALGACAHQVVINTSPSGGTIVVDGVDAGPGPVTYVESTGWRKTAVVEATLEGHQAVRQQLTQAEWSLPLTAAAVCGSLALGSPLTGVGALPLVGLFFARQLPDVVIIPLAPLTGTAPQAPGLQPPAVPARAPDAAAPARP